MLWVQVGHHEVVLSNKKTSKNYQKATKKDIFIFEKNSANSSAMLIYYCITNHFSRLKDLPLRPFE